MGFSFSLTTTSDEENLTPAIARWRCEIRTSCSPLCRHDVREKITFEPARERAHPLAPAFDEQSRRASVGEREIASPPTGQRPQGSADPQLFREAGIFRAERDLTQTEEKESCRLAAARDFDARDDRHRG